MATSASLFPNELPSQVPMSDATELVTDEGTPLSFKAEPEGDPDTGLGLDLPPLSRSPSPPLPPQKASISPLKGNNLNEDELEPLIQKARQTTTLIKKVLGGYRLTKKRVGEALSAEIAQELQCEHKAESVSKAVEAKMNGLDQDLAKIEAWIANKRLKLEHSTSESSSDSEDKDSPVLKSFWQPQVLSPLPGLSPQEGTNGLAPSPLF